MFTAVKVCGGGVIPLFPRGTGAVASGLYLRILSVVPPFLGIAFKSAGILWIMYGTGTESNLKLKLCCTGAGNTLVVVIDIGNTYGCCQNSLVSYARFMHSCISFQSWDFNSGVSPFSNA